MRWSRKGRVVSAVLLVVTLDLSVLAMCRLLPESTWVANVAAPVALIVAVPLTFYVLLVRRLRITPILALPPIAVGIAVSASVADPASPSLYVPLGFAAPVLDLAVGVFEARRAFRVYRSSKESSDNPAGWFESAFSELLGGGRSIVSRLAGLECSIWWYLLCSWGRGPFVREGMGAFSCHEKSGYTVVVAVIMVLCAVESAVVHLALSRISVSLAVIVTLLTAYAMLWIVGDARATVLNPILVGEGVVVIRWGAHFNEEIPVDLISNSGAGETSVAKSERVNLVPIGGDPFWIELTEPVVVRAFAGRKRAVRALAVSPDDRCGLKEALEARAQRCEHAQQLLAKE